MSKSQTLPIPVERRLNLGSRHGIRKPLVGLGLVDSIRQIGSAIPFVSLGDDLMVVIDECGKDEKDLGSPWNTEPSRLRSLCTCSLVSWHQVT